MIATKNNVVNSNLIYPGDFLAINEITEGIITDLGGKWRYNQYHEESIVQKWILPPQVIIKFNIEIFAYNVTVHCLMDTMFIMMVI